MRKLFRLLFLFTFSFSPLFATRHLELGVDRFFNEGLYHGLKGKKVGLITNQTGRDSNLVLTSDLFKSNSEKIQLKAIFAPEHGINGAGYAGEAVKDGKNSTGIPIYSLHGATRRPTAEMLKGIDLLIYDIQDIGCRSYTYATTLYYVMEEAAKAGIKVIVLDRPNPMGGLIVDGPMLEVEWRSFIGYVNVPYCHGMTIGELALYFNHEYQVGCNLEVVAMKGWERSKRFTDLDLAWIPTSPHIPEADTPLYYASTGFLGEIGIVSIGIGYTLPFKLVGAPWIEAEKFAKRLNSAGVEGIQFVPFYFRPFSGAFKGEDCQGVKLVIHPSASFSPSAAQYLLMTTIKAMYPKQFEEQIAKVSKSRKELFNKASGNAEIYRLLTSEKDGYGKMVSLYRDKRERFLAVRKRYLLY